MSERTSCIQHPAGDYFFPQVHEWQYQLCDRDFCRAALLAYFESWHNHRQREQEQATLSARIAEQHGDAPPRTLGLWHWHTMEDLKRDLFFLAKDDKLRAAISWLEGKGFVTTGQNPNPRYKWDRTKYFRFNPGAVQAALEALLAAGYTPRYQARAPEAAAEPTPPHAAVHPRKIGHAVPENRRPSPENRGTFSESSSEASLESSDEREPAPAPVVFLKDDKQPAEDPLATAFGKTPPMQQALDVWQELVGVRPHYHEYLGRFLAEYDLTTLRDWLEYNAKNYTNRGRQIEHARTHLSRVRLICDPARVAEYWPDFQHWLSDGKPKGGKPRFVQPTNDLSILKDYDT